MSLQMESKEDPLSAFGDSATQAAPAHSDSSSMPIIGAPQAVVQQAQDPSIHSNGITLGKGESQHPSKGDDHEQSAANSSAASDAELQRRKAMLLQQVGPVSDPPTIRSVKLMRQTQHSISQLPVLAMSSLWSTAVPAEVGLLQCTRYCLYAEDVPGPYSVFFAGGGSPCGS